MTLTEPTSHPTNTDGDLEHWCCCHDEDRALCGLDITDHPYGTGSPVCVVCHDLLDTDHCPNGWNCT